MERQASWDQSKQQLVSRTRRHPEEAVLYRLVYQFRTELKWSWEERFQPECGALRDEVIAAFDAYLNCGILLHGCARAECESCSHSELIAFMLTNASNCRNSNSPAVKHSPQFTPGCTEADL